jgi:hypothetical protein
MRVEGTTDMKTEKARQVVKAEHESLTLVHGRYSNSVVWLTGENTRGYTDVDN